MNAIFRGRFTAGRACEAPSLPTFHRDQTESIESEPEGQTLAEACDQLLHFLARAIEFARRDRKQPPLRLALVDPRAVDPR